MKKALVLPLLTILLLAGYEGATPRQGEASKNITIQGFRYWSTKRYTRVVVDTDGPIRFTQNRLKNPDRLYFDLKNSRLLKKRNPSIHVQDGILKQVRSGQFKNDIVRVVIDLDTFENFNAFVLKDPYRLVIDVFGRKNARVIPPKEQTGKLSGIRRIIIDPGHGGKDPGAVGPKGLREKNVVLAVAKKLGKILRVQHDMEVIFTRESDLFIPLEERTAIANSKKGDLFISIHTNASRKKRTRGIETYFLNWTNNKEAIRVAARENAISIKKMEEMKNGVQFILNDLNRENKKNESMKLAHNVQSAMVDTLNEKYSKVVDLGVKYALFYVLIGAEMPSILVEISFISNSEEEHRLSRKNYQYRIAEAIAKGIQTYTVPSKIVMRASGNS
jgi:N-acetylmuramoyl-L-alanine amidase